MRKDAESHAAEDKQKRELAEARNQADRCAYQVEKLIKEHDDKLSDADKAPLEAAIDKAREAAKGDDVDAIKRAIDELEQACHALSQDLYESGQAAGPAAAAAPVAAATASRPATTRSIDAEFEVKE